MVLISLWLVCGDKKAINRIFINIIWNALRHAEGNLSIELKKENDGVLISFSREARSKDLGRKSW